MRVLLIPMFLLPHLFAISQELPLKIQEQLENIAAQTEDEIQDDEHLQQLEFYEKHPLPLNLAEKEDFEKLRLLSEFQVLSLLQYRKLMGALIHIYELQAVPGWDLETIRRVKPYLTTSVSFSVRENTYRFRQGEQQLLLRFRRILEKSEGYNKGNGSAYRGDQNHLVLRYRYQYKNSLYFGMAADKDAGEQFFKGAQSKGFDFYSLHFFARDLGKIKSLALGDYQVNLGQGLMQWQGQGWGKSGETAVKRQGSVLQPYRSFGESNFNRGMALQVKTGNVQILGFYSYKKISAHIETDPEPVFTSIQTSGLHRTETEIAGRNSITHRSFGGSIRYEKTDFHLALNGVSHTFSLPFLKPDEPYNYFSFTGRNLIHTGADFSYTFKNLHFFAEFASGQNMIPAFIAGSLINVDAAVELSLLYRHLPPRFYSIFGNVFSENSLPVNEKGLYIGLGIRTGSRARISAYADFFNFSWLKYRVNSPTQGQDYAVQFDYRPDKQFSMSIRFRNKKNYINRGEQTTLDFPDEVDRKNLRLHFTELVSPTWTLKARLEAIWFQNRGKTKNGFLAYIETAHEILSRTHVNLRLQYVETLDYDTRIYAYESDVLYSFSIPAFYGKGFRYYLNLSQDLTKSLSAWFRICRTIQPEGGIGSGADRIEGDHKTEVKFQILCRF